MVRKLEALAAAALLVLAASAVPAPAAQAEKRFTASKYPATLVGSPINELRFHVGLYRLTCATSMQSSLSEALEVIQIVPQYSGCNVPFTTFVGTVWVNGCTFTAKVASVSGSTGTATTTIDCPAGNAIQVYIYENSTKHKAGAELCTYSIPPQGPITSGIDEFHNEGSGSTESIRFDLVVPLSANVVKGSMFLCGKPAGSPIGATYAGKEAGEPVGISWTANQFGNQIGLMIG